MILICTIIMILSAVLFSGCLRRNTDNSHTELRYLTYDKLTRSYRIHIPANTTEYTALLLVLHGGGGTAEHTAKNLPNNDSTDYLMNKN